jgi:hypothetical protein
MVDCARTHIHSTPSAHVQVKHASKLLIQISGGSLSHRSSNMHAAIHGSIVGPVV